MRSCLSLILLTLAACGREVEPLVAVGQLEATLAACQRTQELPDECASVEANLTAKKLEALAGGHTEADLLAAARIATANAPPATDPSPYGRVARAFAAASVPAPATPEAFRFFSSKLSCAQANADGGALALHERVTRDEILGPVDVYLFEAIAQDDRKPCLTLDRFPNGAFVVTAAQYRQLEHDMHYIGERAVAFERVGEHEQKILEEGQRESRINAEIARIVTAAPQKKCPQDRNQFTCENYLRGEAKLNLGLITQAELDGPPSGMFAAIGRAVQAGPFTGEWCWNTSNDHAATPKDESERAVWVTLEGSSAGLIGRHCVRDPEGREVDCVDLTQAAPTIRGTWDGNGFSVKVHSALGDEGEGRIHEGNGGLRWTMTKAAGPYLPISEVQLSKCNTLDERLAEAKKLLEQSKAP